MYVYTVGVASLCRSNLYSVYVVPWGDTTIDRGDGHSSGPARRGRWACLDLRRNGVEQLLQQKSQVDKLVVTTAVD